jgi:hypothetical protein
MQCNLNITKNITKILRHCICFHAKIFNKKLPTSEANEIKCNVILMLQIDTLNGYVFTCVSVPFSMSAFLATSLHAAIANLKRERFIVLHRRRGNKI